MPYKQLYVTASDSKCILNFIIFYFILFIFIFLLIHFHTEEAPTFIGVTEIQNWLSYDTLTAATTQGVLICATRDFLQPFEAHWLLYLTQSFTIRKFTFSLQNVCLLWYLHTINGLVFITETLRADTGKVHPIDRPRRPRQFVGLCFYSFSNLGIIWGFRQFQPLYPRKEGLYSPRRRLGVTQESAKTDGETFVPTGIGSPDRPARSKSLYRLRYSGPSVWFYVRCELSLGIRFRTIVALRGLTTLN